MAQAPRHHALTEWRAARLAMKTAWEYMTNAER
jgi:hypothetical protein